MARKVGSSEECRSISSFPIRRDFFFRDQEVRAEPGIWIVPGITGVSARTMRAAIDAVLCTSGIEADPKIRAGDLHLTLAPRWGEIPLLFEVYPLTRDINSIIGE